MATTDEVDLAYCMSLPPKEAVAYLASKGFAITWDWQELWQESQAQAFTVAKVTRLDILQDIREAVETALKEGKTLAWFTKELTPVLQAKGWWGKHEVTDEATGEISQVQLGSPYRLKTIYRTNIQTAYMAGRFQEQLANADDRPFWQYVAILDGRTRPSHRAMNGKVFRYDDPIWQYFYPPNGWGCRCRVKALSGSNLERRGLLAESSTGMLEMGKVTLRSGEERVMAMFRATDPATGNTITVTPDAGWSYNPGAAAWTPEKSRYTGPLAKLADKELS